MRDNECMSDNPLGIAVTTARAHVLCAQYSHGVPGDDRHLERQDRHAHHVRLEDIVFQGESIHGSCVGASSASQLGDRACVRERARAVVTQQVSLLLLIVFQFDFTVCLFSWHPAAVCNKLCHEYMSARASCQADIERACTPNGEGTQSGAPGGSILARAHRAGTPWQGQRKKTNHGA